MVGGLQFLILLATIALARTSMPPGELADMTECKSYGIDSLAANQSFVPLPNAYNSTSNQSVALPVFTSMDLARKNPHIETVIVLVHGASGDANTYFCQAVMASRGHMHTAVVAPWFGNQQVASANWTGSQGDVLSAFWTTSNWLQGGDSSAGPSSPPFHYTTSFDAVDAVLLTASRAFENANIVLVGFSAGAQLTSRFAFATVLDLDAMRVQVIVSDPSSYLYLDGRRPAASCRPLIDTGPLHSCSAFGVPPEASACSAYNDYKYGVLNFNNKYTDHFNNDSIAVAKATQAYLARRVAFLLGQADACNCRSEGYLNNQRCVDPSNHCTNDGVSTACCDSYPDGRTNALDVSCAGMLQGSNRLQRGLLYGSYLYHVWGAEIDMEVVPYLAHNSTGLLTSKQFQARAWRASSSSSSSPSSSSSSSSSHTASPARDALLTII